MHEIIPFHELARLRTIQRFLDLNINEESELRDIVKMVAEQCGVPLAAITLANGAAIVENSLGYGFLGKVDFFYDKVISEQKLLVFDAAELEDLWRNNIAGLNNHVSIRFYAGLPITTQDGHPLGSLCLMDVKPAHLTDMLVAIMEIFSKQVIRTLEFEVSIGILSQLYQDAKKSDDKMKSFFESSAYCHLLIGKDFKILAFNKALKKFVMDTQAVDVSEGIDIRSLVHPDHMDRFVEHYQIALKGMSVNYDVELNYKEELINWAIAFETAYNSDNEIIGVSYNAINVTDRVQQEKLLVAQNHNLKEIAFIQSHELRRPLSTILGAIELIELEDLKILPEDLSVLKQAAHELDGKIKKVIDFTDKLSISR